MTRIYPDEPSGPFPEPPIAFTDGEDRQVEIRKASGTDEEELVDMYDRFDPGDRAQGIPPVEESAIRDWLDVLLGEDTFNVVAVHDESVVGHAMLVPDEEDAYELAIFVLHDYQGAGIGTHLLEGLLGHAAAHGVERVWLTVERWNQPARSLYRKLGFEASDTSGFELEMAIRLEN